jgi:hypothetical protein
MKNKGDFIIDLLNSKKLSHDQSERILQLSASEYGNSNEEYQNILQKIDYLQMICEENQKKTATKLDVIIRDVSEKINTQNGVAINISGTEDSSPKSNILTHKPIEIKRFLKNFEENTALKFSTHIWDKTDFLATYGSFIAKLNEEKKEYKFNDLFKYNRPLYNLLNYFLFTPNKNPLRNGIPTFGWNSEEYKDVKIGWQFPEKILNDWAFQNYDTQSSENKKYPMEMIVPPELIPEERIRNKKINSFEDIANIFKTEIQFRNDEDNLFKHVKFSLGKHNLTNEDKSIENLQKLHFYTYTKGITSAIDSIFRSFEKNNESFKDVSFDVISKQDYLELQITQLNSFPSKDLDVENPNKFFSGDSSAIVNHLFSLCDYSIISKFNNESNFEIVILFENAFGTPDGNNLKKLDSKMDVIELKNEVVKGFTHKLKFYV